ncbi:GNAT family N-acetyltransferase [Nocardioides sp. BP30]|uniref:GNAT family N-acetyltransferase n=1 Tax=Nocardioides sp. BP30 TaxID=3036374 RepID=UPI002469305A|nr:GNAT family N-acetyltransferase [Nocardioides sp. BP30]WGL52504.1 GNAT family N-acetyltransferase [Nocardioides sp. BP30]
MSIDATELAQADTDAAKAVAKAGVEVRELHDLGDLHGLADLFVTIWGGNEPLISGDLLRAMSKAGSYVVGAYRGERMVGGCVGFHEAPGARTLHSHIAGVLPELIGHAIGSALKLHQRAWALHRGITAIEWTYDPLVARNAYFNIVKLGARPAEYLTNFYGAMNDAINGVDDSDRILIRWDLLDPPTRSSEPTQEGEWVPVPADIEGLRVADLEGARAWRTQLRQALAPRLDRGWRIVGFDRASGYLLEPPTPTAPDTGSDPAADPAAETTGEDS